MIDKISGSTVLINNSEYAQYIKPTLETVMNGRELPGD